MDSLWLAFPFLSFRMLQYTLQSPQRMDVLLCLPGPLLCSQAGLPGFGRESLTVQWLAAVADAHSHGVLSAAESCFLSHAELVCMSAAAPL